MSRLSQDMYDLTSFQCETLIRAADSSFV